MIQEPQLPQFPVQLPPLQQKLGYNQPQPLNYIGS